MLLRRVEIYLPVDFDPLFISNFYCVGNCEALDPLFFHTLVALRILGLTVAMHRHLPFIKTKTCHTENTCKYCMETLIDKFCFSRPNLYFLFLKFFTANLAPTISYQCNDQQEKHQLSGHLLQTHPEIYENKKKYCNSFRE